MEIESACANVMAKVYNSSCDHSVTAPIIGDIKDGMMMRGACLLRKAWREQNMAAHNLAQFALKLGASRISYFIVPLCIQDLVYAD
jgi:hypothetical protein